MHPEAQERAQKELDDVIRDRLPEAGDLDHLPYIQAIWQEALRWHAPVPLREFALAYGLQTSF